MTEVSGGPRRSADAAVDVSEPEEYRGATDSEFRRHNQDVDWGRFVSSSYWKHNYQQLREDDREIIQTVARFFDQHFRSHPVPPGTLRGIDVGSGANLYPSLLMLPWSGKVTLADVADSNRDWLTAVIESDFTDSGGRWWWEPFWAVPATLAAYDAVSDPRSALRRRHQVKDLSVMELPARSWDLGTMFFVAESMTSYEGEFEDACDRFMESLTPGAPFAAAFMDSSVGYVVADQSFPAVSEVNAKVVEAVLGRHSKDVDVKPIEVPALDPLRDGYKGMIIATGTTLVS